MNEKGEITILALGLICASILIAGFMVAYKPTFSVELRAEHRVGQRVILAEMP